MIGKIISAAAVFTAAAGVTAMKKKNICPVCEVKKLISKCGVHIKAVGEYGNNAALTPPMGWSSWNTFRNNINEQLILDTADAMKKSGLLDAGYQYVNLDDCWHSSVRDKDGRLQGDLKLFSSGIKSLVQQLNEKGFKAGIYSSNGTLTCEDLPASLGNERIDAETFADWGIEYFKYDYCHHKLISSLAPNIDKIIISGDKLTEDIVLEAENGELYGTAKVITDEKGSYISHLDSGNGSVRFSFVNVPEDGEYVLTVVFVKSANKKKKYLEITVNADESYPMEFPETKAWSREGRTQTLISLNKGDNTIELKNPIGSPMDSAATQYKNMGKELKRATKLYAEKHNVPENPIVYSICEWGTNQPWKWGAEAGNLWRTTPDIKPIWPSVLAIYEANVRLYKYASVGAWNDPDMLEVGNGKLTYEENKSHFSLWCMMASPLILGNDIRTFINSDGKVDESNKVLSILKNKELIAIDQDKKGCQCRRVKTNVISDVLVKPLEGGEVAVCLFNKSPSTLNMTVSLKSIADEAFVDLNNSGNYQYTELWDNEISVTNDKITADVPSHGVKVYRVKSI